MATSMSPASDVIIDASMPNLIRVGGQMWNMDDKLKNCQKKAEEYGNHNKTFEIVSEGTITVTNADGNKIFEHAMQAGVIWRMCQAARSNQGHSHPGLGAEDLFWPDPTRAHDANLIY